MKLDRLYAAIVSNVYSWGILGKFWEREKKPRDGLPIPTVLFKKLTQDKENMSQFGQNL